MEGLLRQRHHEGRLSGILNGVDDSIWSPETDLLLAARYDRDRWKTKRRTSVSCRLPWA
jgi:starch synthase